MSLILDELTEIGSQIMIMQYMAVVTTSLLFYEYIISFSEEVNLIWPSRLSIGKIIFLLNRYPPFITAGTASFIIVSDVDFPHCKAFFVLGGASTLAGYIFAEATLFLRSHALWSTGRVMPYVIWTVYFLGVPGSIYITTRFLISFTPSPIHIFPTGCELLAPNKIEWVGLSILLVTETFALSLLVIKRSIHSRRNGSVSNLLRTMHTDGVLYFIGVLDTALLMPQSILHSILCNRLLLSVRTADIRDEQASYDTSEVECFSSGRPQLTSFVSYDE
ncbi:hypothetical protein SCHPADRAFT_178390 [Schizopora paradoxa]|uniref:DUF6533 domain-containing protein n=1 Tax=Schizopora paradoxa TaxID=27342 RepID=A0A0H2RYQ8_9AGAM|nr:hypothetical protein SCHPADRAFT_178390 [Schizopora paradoxa]